MQWDKGVLRGILGAGRYSGYRTSTWGRWSHRKRRKYFPGVFTVVKLGASRGWRKGHAEGSVSDRSRGRSCRPNPHNKQNELIGLNDVLPRAVEELKVDEPRTLPGSRVLKPYLGLQCRNWAGRMSMWEVPCNTQRDADSKCVVQSRSRGVQPQNQNAGNMNRNNVLGKSKGKS